MNITKLSSKYQIVVPSKVREALGLKAGTKVSLYPVDRDRAMLVKRSVDPVIALEGLGKEVWQQLGGADSYIKQERAAWDKK